MSSINRKATMAKRARELEQKDRAKEREQRRAERRARAEARAASGQVGPEIGQPVSLDDPPPADQAGDPEDSPDTLTNEENHG
jgi:hypothetical protein